jgi:hypothetical protein
MKNEQPWCWERFLVEGDMLFNYMIHNFDKMLPLINDTSGEYFDIFDLRYSVASIGESCEKLKENHIGDIQSELIRWIQNEQKEGRLFNNANWKPFRDLQHMTYMVLGYKHMFVYKKYYLQLTMDSYYAPSSNMLEDNNFPHFKLALYGWRDDSHDKLEPLNYVVIPSDNIMPERYWKIK